jgi:hypothetical protein
MAFMVWGLFSELFRFKQGREIVTNWLEILAGFVVFSVDLEGHAAIAGVAELRGVAHLGIAFDADGIEHVGHVGEEVALDG